MKHPRILSGCLAAILAAALPMPCAQADTVSAPVVKVSAGALVGIIRNSTNMPVAGATVTATRKDGSGIRASISGSDGMYSFADVAPGEWSLTLQADGTAEISA